MRVLFDGFWWARGPVSNRQVMREFVFAWLDEYPDDEVVVAVRHRDRAQAREELPARVDVVGTRLAPQGLSAVVELPFIARRRRIDAMITHNFTPLFGRSAVFVHDLMFETNPEWFTRKEMAYFKWMPWTLPRARWVLTSSRAEAARITRVARRHPDVVPIGLGLAPGLAAATPEPPDESLPGSDFLLAVGRLNARKNLRVAIDAAVASGVVSPSCPLLIVGEPGGKSAEFPAHVQAAVNEGSVKFLGFIDDAQLAWLYGHARVFLFMSLDEGFGMPTLEALHFGCPVVASDIPAFREILGEHADLVAPDDVPGAAAAIARVFHAPRPGPVDVDARGYSWRRSVRRMRAAMTSMP